MKQQMLSFKQYLASKQKLREAIEKSPVYQQQYIVNKYCKFPIVESGDSKTVVPLKPKSCIIVEWQQIDQSHRVPLAVSFKNVIHIDEDEQYDPYWSTQKFVKWLLNTTHEDLSDYL